MSDYDRAYGILQANKDKTFVKRILEPQNYPTMDWGNGQVATHQMAWGEVDGKYVVYPTILYDGKQLKHYGDDAWKHASQSGNYIEFPSAQEADWFSQNYKSAWGGTPANQLPVAPDQ